MDAINGTFELLGALCIALNIRRLLRDKAVRGVQWQATAIFATWSMWNLGFYGSLHLSASLIGAGCMAVGQATWVTLAIKYRKPKEPQGPDPTRFLLNGLNGIASCATACDCCEMHRRIATSALNNYETFSIKNPSP